MPFKIKVADIPLEGERIPLDMTTEDLAERLEDLVDDRIEVVGPLEGHLNVAPTGLRMVVRGVVNATVRVACARCLEEFDLPVAEDVFVVYAPHSEMDREDEAEAEAVNQEFYEGETIDLWPIIQEHLVMGVPYKPLCDEDCKGLCPICGQNKNTGQCQCVVQAEHTGLARLQEIKDKLPK